MKRAGECSVMEWRNADMCAVVERGANGARAKDARHSLSPPKWGKHLGTVYSESLTARCCSLLRDPQELLSEAAMPTNTPATTKKMLTTMDTKNV